MDKRILILKQLTGDISLDERNQLKAWLEEHPGHVDIRNQIRSDWRMSKEAKESVESHAEKNIRAIQNNIVEAKKKQKNPAAKSKVKPTERRISIDIPYVPILLAIGMGVGLFFAYKFYPKNDEAEKVERQLTTMLGEVRSHVLPDQSKIWLNAKSEMKYVAAVEENGQEIYFKGEGFFNINSRGDRESTIHLPKILIKTNNAQFNVSEKEVVTGVNIHVESGEVAVHSQDGKFITKILSRQSGIVSYEDYQFERDEKYNPNVTSWKTRKLIFKNVTLSEAILDIEDYFDRKILVEENKIKSCPLTISFEELDINRILSKLASQYSMQLTQGIHGDYILRGGSCD